MFLSNWNLILKSVGIAVLLIVCLVLFFVFMIRSLRASYKEVYNFQSKFDIDLRKTLNLISKIQTNEELNHFLNLTIKELSFSEKKDLLFLLEQNMLVVDSQNEDHQYVIETYRHLQEMKRQRDSQAIIYNHKVKIFPFNLLSRLLDLPEFGIYTEKK